MGCQNNVPSGVDAEAAIAEGQKSLTTAEPAPCASYRTGAKYTIAFEVKDANGNLCKKMYYSVKYELSGDAYTETTDENGLTECYFATGPSEKIYLYIGHRRKNEDGFPADRSEAENAHDEAPLANGTVAEILSASLKPSDCGSLGKLRNEVKILRPLVRD